MNFIAIILFTCIVLPSDGFNDDDYDSKYGQLVFASILFRHGDRTPIYTFPFDKYGEEIWQEGMEQLTQKGKERSYELGKWYRERYKRLLGPRYHVNHIYVMSSEKDRTMMSAECFLAGLYPPNESEVWNPHFRNWQPIPVHSITVRLDNVLSFGRRCNMVTYEENSLSQLPHYKSFYSNHLDAINYISKHSNLKFDPENMYAGLQEFAFAYDLFRIQESHNLTLPKWSNPVYPEIMRTIAVEYLYSNFYTTVSKRLVMGTLLEIMIRNMTEKRDGTLNPNRTMAIYSDGDTHIIGILSVLGVYKPHLPTFSSSVMIELRKLDGQYNVLVLYRNSTDEEEPELMEMPECPLPCSLDDFITATKPFIIQNYEKECKVNNNNNKNNNYYTIIITFPTFFFALTILFMLCVCFWCCKIKFNATLQEKYEKI